MSTLKVYMRDNYRFCSEAVFLEVSTQGYQINLHKINPKCQRQFQYKDLPGLAAPSSINRTFLAGPVMVGGRVSSKEGWQGLGVHRLRSYMFGSNAYIRYFPPLSHLECSGGIQVLYITLNRLQLFYLFVEMDWV